MLTGKKECPGSTRTGGAGGKENSQSRERRDDSVRTFRDEQSLMREKETELLTKVKRDKSLQNVKKNS